MKLPVWLRVNGKKLPASTSNVSARGIVLEFDSELENPSITFEMTFPPEITLSTSLQVRCEGNVVRVIDDQPHHKAVAVRIHRYEFLRNSRKRKEGQREVA